MKTVINKFVNLQTTAGGLMHRFQMSRNRLLKVCCVPATSASLPRVSFFFSFLFLLQWPFTVPIKQTRQAVHAIKQWLYSEMSMVLCYILFISMAFVSCKVDR